jgi:hypothetical protein
MLETDDISIGQERWIKWVQLDPDDKDLYYIDHLLEPLEPLWKNLETECVAACCGIGAFALWPEDIQIVSKHLNSKELKLHFLKMKNELLLIEQKIVVSKKLNIYLISRFSLNL